MISLVNNILAIDAGWGGAVALHAKPKRKEDIVIGVTDCPGDPLGVLRLLRGYRKRFGRDGWYAYLEANTPSPKFGARGNFGLGGNVLCWETALTAEDIPFTNINPKEWQKICSNIKSRKKKGREASKERAWRFARQHFSDLASQLGDNVPSVRSRQQGRADALCILYWAVTERKGE